jgi:hypothetical protein
MRLDKYKLQSIYNIINVRMCGGVLPPATIILSTEVTKKISETVTQVGGVITTEIRTQCKDALIGYSYYNEGGIDVLDVTEPVTITYYPHLNDEPIESHVLVTWHEICHGLTPNGGHGPAWTQRVIAGGMTVANGTGDNGEEVQVADHEFIPGGDLERVFKAWLDGERESAPTVDELVARQDQAKPQAWGWSKVGPGGSMADQINKALPKPITSQTIRAENEDEPIDLIMIDTSVSVGGDLFDAILTGVGVAMKGLKKKPTLIVFNSDAWVIQNVNEIPQPAGCTALHDALSLAMQFNPKHSIIISDGSPDDSDGARYFHSLLPGSVSVHYAGYDYPCGSEGYDYKFLKSLVRGCGKMTAGQDKGSIAGAVGGFDAAKEVELVLGRVGNHAKLMTYLPKLAAGIEQLNGQVHTLALDAQIGKAERALTGVVDKTALSWMENLEQISDQNEAQRQKERGLFANGLKALGDKTSTAIGQGFTAVGQGLAPQMDRGRGDGSLLLSDFAFQEAAPAALQLPRRGSRDLKTMPDGQLALGWQGEAPMQYEGLTALPDHSRRNQAEARAHANASSGSGVIQVGGPVQQQPQPLMLAAPVIPTQTQQQAQPAPLLLTHSPEPVMPVIPMGTTPEPVKTSIFDKPAEPVAKKKGLASLFGRRN